MDALSLLIVGPLAVFTLRRLAVLGASLVPPRPASAPAPGETPRVVVLVAVRDETARLPSLLAALDAFDYPPERLAFVLADDGSLDGTGELLRAWAAGRAGAAALAIAPSVGKAEALRRAIAAAPAESELVAVYDADLAPRPDALRRLAAVFADPRVGAASGYRRPSNAARSLASAYAALESWVHQLVTQQGKDRLGWNPTTMGGHCVYRRAALDQVGGFPSGALSEDIEVSLALVRAGWRTRFVSGAIAEGRLVETIGEFRRQRVRWTRGIYNASPRASGVEGRLVAAGYADRLVLLVAIAAAAAGRLSPAWPAAYLAVPILASAAALAKASPGWGAVVRLVLGAPLLFAVDLAATVEGTLRRRVAWRGNGGRPPTPS